MTALLDGYAAADPVAGVFGRDSAAIADSHNNADASGKRRDWGD